MNKKIRTPIRWVGGKGQHRNWIVPLLEKIPHKRYVEPFGGGASILLSKDRVDIETYNDLDSSLYDFFTVLADPSDFNKFYRYVGLLPYSREVWQNSRDTWLKEQDKVLRTAKWFVLLRQSFSGNSTSWGSGVTGVACTAPPNSWVSIIRLLPEIHSRLQYVQIENDNALTVLDRYDTSETLFYCDPPYVLKTRKSGGYTHEMTDSDHVDLIKRLKGVKGFVVLSGYDSDVYDELDWNKITVNTVTRVTGLTRTRKDTGKGSLKKNESRIETLWFNDNAWNYIGE